MKYTILSIAVLMTFAVACEKNSVEDPQDFSSAYHDISVGNHWVYQMDSIEFAGTGAPPDTFNYQLKHTVVDLLLNDGQEFYVIEIESRKDSTANWKIERVYSLSLSNEEVVKNDFDLNELVLSKPFSLNKLWDGNQYNSEPRSNYYIDSLHHAFEVNGMPFDSAITILQEEQINLVNSYQGKEIYAKDVGLVYKEKEYLSNLTDPNKVTGYKYTMSLIEFEK